MVSRAFQKWKIYSQSNASQQIKTLEDENRHIRDEITFLEDEKQQLEAQLKKRSKVSTEVGTEIYGESKSFRTNIDRPPSTFRSETKIEEAPSHYQSQINLLNLENLKIPEQAQDPPSEQSVREISFNQPVESTFDGPNDVHDRLYNEALNKNTIKEQNEYIKQQIELQDCTFQPNSTSRSRRRFV